MSQPNRYHTFFICLILAFITAAVYYPVRTYDFVNYDDQIYVYDNPNIQSGLTFDAVKQAFTSSYANFWHPLTMLSYMLDWQLFGNNAAGFHLTNLIFHIANALLLFIVLKQMTSAIWQSAFVAALFALHPLHVESVAWVSQRKDVLSTFFWFLTMWAYVRYVKQSQNWLYLLTMLFFALGLMAKPMLVTLPFVFLLLDYWPLERFSKRNIYRLILEKIPFIVLSMILSVIAFLVQPTGTEAMRLAKLDLKIRIFNAIISYVEYIGKTFWPRGLTVFYPLIGKNISVLYVVIAAAILLAVTVFVICLAKKHRYLPTGWFWYLGTLVPVIGLIPVGEHAMADRYTYITLTGLFIMISWGAADLLAKSRHKKIILTVLALLIVLILSICSRLQLRHWRSSLDLFQHALNVTQNNYTAHYCVAQVFASQGNINEASYHYSQAVRILPDYVEAISDLGVVRHQQGRIDEAVSLYERALRIDPNFAGANLNLAAAYADRGDFKRAAAHYKTGLASADIPALRRNYASVLVRLGRFEDAVAEYRKVLSAIPDDPYILNEFGIVLMKTGKFDEAILHFKKALQIAPNYTDAKNNLNAALAEKQKTQK
jgi:tetratricopeptide (TPR) repeat protein